MATLLAVGEYWWSWADLLVRWLHVIAAIAWIGTSFYFIALDDHLRAPAEPRDGIGGESWEIHGGGFYRVDKYAVAPATLPDPLHWFKWEAYTTWLSGLALFLVVYYLHASTFLVDRSVADLTGGEAIAISLAGLALAWLVYDGLCRVLGRDDRALAVAVLASLTLAAWGAGRLFSGRASYVEVGAMIGTMMAGNVFFVIMPAQRELVRAKRERREPDPRHNARGKQRSVHNNYLTLPVLFAMLAGHFPFTYGHSQAWLILVVIMAVGAWIRLFFNLRHAGRTVWAIPLSAAAALVVLAFAIEPSSSGGSGATGATVPFATARRIV
ncbi:MAG TPA: urate hydroxylase PuuD, partial [Gaiellaceae bacterium]|nr:urate hydroxylase PuuD [Gaiellaceae bacterium]